MRRLSTRLLIWFLGIALAPLAVAGLVVAMGVNRAAANAVLATLTVAADNQVSKLETYVLERQRAVTILARTPTVIGIVRRLNSNVGGAQNDSLTSGTRPFFEYVAARSGYLDVILIDPNGTVLNTLNNSIGMHIRDTARGIPELARVFDQVRTMLTTEISDFAIVPFHPTPVAYVAAPVIENGRLIGVIAFQLDSTDFTRVMNDRTGLGETGEAYAGILTENNATVVTPQRFNPNAAFRESYPIGGERAQALQEAVRGNEGRGERVDYRGEQVVAVWRYVPSLRWGLVVKQDVTEAFAVLRTQSQIMLGFATIMLSAVTLIAYTVSRSITQPIERLTGAVRAFAAGNREVRVTQAGAIKNRDEIGVLAAGFDQMASEIAEQVNTLETRVKDRTQQISEYADRMDHARQEAENARNEAERANQSKTIFLTSMSHELRTPLNAILGFAQVMERDQSLSAKQHEHIGIILRSGEHLLGLINDVLEMSKIEAGQMTLNESVYDLRDLLRGIEEMMQVRASAKGLQLLFELEDDIPRYIRSDEGKLRQILINIVGNGIKFTKEGGVTVRVARTPSASVPTLLFEIEDSGHGIAPDEIEMLFQPFVQSESGRKTQEGTGLGLTLSRQFARLMGGDITVQSQLGEGTIFTITMQYVEASAADLPAVVKPRRVRSIDPADTRDYRILIVDDKAENRQLMRTWLTPVGFNVREAANGQEAIQIWEQWSPQLIWMDMRMPVMSGYEATRHIKSSDKGNETIIIALTASALDAEKTSIMTAGCDDFVRKPTRESIIMEKLVKHLGVKFIYEDEQPPAAPTPATADPVTPDSFAALPAEWRARLREAADRLDVEATNALIAQLRATHPVMAAVLAEWIASFRFDKVLALFTDQSSTPTP